MTTKSAWPWETRAAWDGTWTTRCRHCEATHDTPYHSQLDAWRRAHECPTESGE
jgi:hypothetical protein